MKANRIPHAPRLIVGLLLMLSGLVTSAQDRCAEDPACREATNILAEQVVRIIQSRLPDEAAATDSLRQAALEQLGRTHPDEHHTLLGIVLQYAQWVASGDRSRPGVFLRHFERIEDIGWITFLQTKLLRSEIKSIEFRRGSGLHTDLMVGGTDLFKPTESYLISGRILLAHTFSGPLGGGRHRILIGPSFYYWQQRVRFLVNPRYEYRLKDLQMKFGSILNAKLITQANFNREYLIVGGGLGLEIATNLGGQVLVEFFNKEKAYLLQAGVFYRIKLSEK